MHGLVFEELEKFVGHKWGEGGWAGLLEEAGLGGRQYLATQESPDHELAALVMTAAKRSGGSVEDVLEEFGAFVAPDLISLYSASIDTRWRTLDVIAHTEETIHKVVRRTNPDARPPRLACTRTSPDAVTVVYASPRKLCAFAKGLMRGIGKHFGERVAITESTCMHHGAECCTLHVTLAK